MSHIILLSYNHSSETTQGCESGNCTSNELHILCWKKASLDVVVIMEISCLAVSQECRFSIFTRGLAHPVLWFCVGRSLRTLWLVAQPLEDSSHYSPLCEIWNKRLCPNKIYHVLCGTKDGQVHCLVISQPGSTTDHEQVRWQPKYVHMGGILLCAGVC